MRFGKALLVTFAAYLITCGTGAAAEPVDKPGAEQIVAIYTGDNRDEMKQIEKKRVIEPNSGGASTQKQGQRVSKPTSEKSLALTGRAMRVKLKPGNTIQVVKDESGGVYLMIKSNAAAPAGDGSTARQQTDPRQYNGGSTLEQIATPRTEIKIGPVRCLHCGYELRGSQSQNTQNNLHRAQN